MDDIEENIGADTAQGMYKNRTKNRRNGFEIPATYFILSTRKSRAGYYIYPCRILLNFLVPKKKKKYLQKKSLLFYTLFIDSSQIESQASVDVFETSVEIHPIPQEVTSPSPPKISNSKIAKLLKNSKSSVTTSSKGHSSATTTSIQSSDKLSTPLRNNNSLPEIEGKF